MAAKPTVKFIGKSGGAVHVVTTKREDLKHSKCPTVKKGHDEGTWPRKSLSPEAALALKGCVKCNTHEVAEAERKARMTPAQRRSEARRVRDETMAKAGTSKQGKPKKGKAEKEPKQRRGPKGGDVAARMKDNVERHAEFAKEHGWKVTTCGETGPSEWTCAATRNGEAVKIIWRDGRTVWSRVVLASGVEVRLRNSSNWRKHVEGTSKIKPDYAPRQAGGKKAAKAEVIDDNVVDRNLPFSLEDDDDAVVESLLGKRITWRNSQSRALDSAVVPMRSRNVRITVHPKGDRRIVSFYESQGMGEAGEMLGGERSVYLDKILKVRSGR